MVAEAMALNDVFQALADPVRRGVLARLARGPASTTELARPARMALPSFLQHLQVLQRCGLVRSTKVGRVRTYELTPAPLKRAEGWMSLQRAAWERRLDQLDAHLLKMKAEES